MASPFDLSLVVEMTVVATVRVLPDLVDNFGVTAIYDTIVALNPAVTASWMTALLFGMQVLLFLISGSFGSNDPLWSLFPPIYACLYCLHPVISLDRRTGASIDTRLSVMCFLVFVWSIRRTFNAARCGFCSPRFVRYMCEWMQAAVIKSKFLFGLFYMSFCFFLTIMLAFIASPLYFAWVQRGLDPTLTYLDGVASVGMLACIALQAVADAQQYAFQKGKAAWPGRSARPQDDSLDRNMPPIHKEYEDGFLQSGLYRWSRHPNFLAEISIWWFFYIFSVSASRRWFNWTIIGPISYTCLFGVTTPLTEYITSQKYPAYRRYQRRTFRFIPMLFQFVSFRDRSAEEAKKTN